ncbi:ARM repeat superfamily protein [Rhynchospora pubera]|uniref:ARM repeat superfamily protein n=1 Tax=Rhynchospora pubera TaxID=906938 RepID=A0AAV8HGZ1_9POAL|nr:ARM repeat superfamily protein [Rhynchospora pubera]
MGFISRKIFPSCENLCVCCPSLRPSSRRPVKRYKKLLAEIFPKTEDGAVNERKIMKLCEYAAKNPPRIPKIVKFLEQRSQKELRIEHVSFIKIITESYGKLLFVCKEQMAYFATSLVKVVNELLESKHQEIQILGCQTLTRFIYSQADNTYARNIESLVSKVCSLSNDSRENHTHIRASSLQCLSAMIWFMTEYSYMFSEFDEIVSSILKNYRSDDPLNEEEDGSAAHHNWVDEIVRCEGRAGGTVSSDISPRNPTMRIRPNTGDTSTLTREQRESPEMWAHECVQKFGELAKESTTTMRRVLDPMLIYFDFEKQWSPRHGLALLVLSDMSCTEKSFGNERLVLSTVIRHLDHKNVVNNPQMKADIVQVATSLVRQLRSRGVVAEMGVVSDLCRHLRKCLEAIGQTGSGIEESNWNESLQNSLEDCLLEIVKGISDVRLLFEMMAITLEKLSDSAAVARATIGSLLILSHIISLTTISSQNLTVFPEALLLQLLKAMTHPDPESRLGAHLLFSSVLVKTPNHPRSDSEFLYETKKWQSRTTSVFASATALLEKLRREKESLSGDSKTGNNSKERVCEKELKSSWGPQKSSVFFTKLGFSVFDRAPVLSGTNEMDGNTTVMLTEDQATQLLSAIWVQANQADNLPFNFEAIGHTFCLTLLASSVKNLNNGNVVRFFQLPLSLRIVALTPSEILPPACQRSLYTMAMSMLAFAGKFYNICKLTNSLKRYVSSNIDPYLRIGEDLLLYVRLQSDLNNFGSDIDHDAARCTLNEVREAVISDQHLLDIITQALSSLINLKKDVLLRLLSENFVPEDVPLFGSSTVLDWVNAHACSEESLSLDEECSRTSSVDGGIASESPATNFSSLAPKITPQPSLPNVISVGQLLESVLHVAGQVAVSSVSTSPLPYGTMASQCEALGMGSRKKLSSWLVNSYDSAEDNITQDLHMGHHIPMQKVNSCSSEIELTKQTEPWLTLKLPPASPFDNFLKAAGC